MDFMQCRRLPLSSAGSDRNYRTTVILNTIMSTPPIIIYIIPGILAVWVMLGMGWFGPAFRIARTGAKLTRLQRFAYRCYNWFVQVLVVLAAAELCAAALWASYQKP